MCRRLWVAAFRPPDNPVREIQPVTQNGRIRAEAISRAIVATTREKIEYELEAEATYWLLKNGLQASAYPAIVG